MRTVIFSLILVFCSNVYANQLVVKVPLLDQLSSWNLTNVRYEIQVSAFALIPGTNDFSRFNLKDPLLASDYPLFVEDLTDKPAHFSHMTEVFYFHSTGEIDVLSKEYIFCFSEECNQPIQIVQDLKGGEITAVVHGESADKIRASLVSKGAVPVEISEQSDPFIASFTMFYQTWDGASVESPWTCNTFTELKDVQVDSGGLLGLLLDWIPEGFGLAASFINSKRGVYCEASVAFS